MTQVFQRGSSTLAAVMTLFFFGII
ncbi:DUF2509 domain-containing protein, partial [Yersinia pestis]